MAKSHSWEGHRATGANSLEDRDLWGLRLSGSSVPLPAELSLKKKEGREREGETEREREGAEEMANRWLDIYRLQQNY